MPMLIIYSGVIYKNSNVCTSTRELNYDSFYWYESWLKVQNPWSGLGKKAVGYRGSSNMRLGNQDTELLTVYYPHMIDYNGALGYMPNGYISVSLRSICTDGSESLEKMCLRAEFLSCWYTSSFKAVKWKTGNMTRAHEHYQSRASYI